MAYPSAWTIETGTPICSGTGYTFIGGFRWRIESQDILANTSVVTIQLWATRTGANGLTNSNLRTSFVEYDNNPGTRQNISTSFNFLAANTILNTKYYCGTDTAQFNGNSVQITVAHNSDGTRTVPIHTYHLANMANWMSVDTSVTITLDTIPRVSLLSSFNDFQIETTAGAISGNTNVYSASFYHRFKLLQGSTEVASWDIGQLSVGAYAYALSLTATQRNAIFAAMPTIDNQLFTLQLITYNDAARTVQIGSTQTKTATGTIPVSYKPTITTANSNFTWTNKNSKLTSYLIQNISTLTLLLSGGVAPTGATLSNYQVRYGSILRSGAYTGAAISENVGLIANSGTLYAYYSVQDSRGRWSVEISEQLLGNALGVKSYSPPLNNGFDVRRNVTTPTSADYILKFGNSLYSLGNTWTYTLYYWNVSTWTVAKAATAIASASIDTIYTHALPYSESGVYDVKVVLTDLFNSVEYTDTMPTSEFPASFGKKGMGIGKDTSDTYNLEVGPLGMSSDGDIFVKGLNIKDAVSVNGIDMNTIKQSGTYYGYNMTNAAAQVISVFQVIVYSPDWVVQVQYTIGAPTKEFHRSYYNGNTWGPWTNTALDAYPIGAIYQSTVSTSPATLFGGTWVAVGDRFLLGAGTKAAGETGGESDHTLTTQEIPSHNHQQMANGSGGSNGGYFNSLLYNTGGGNTNTNNYTVASGGNWSHNNMPPYLAVYMWKRTA